MTPLEDVQAHVLRRCVPLNPLSLPVADTLGLVLAVDVVAAERVPPFDNTAVDGYAVRAADVQTTPCELAVVDEIAAGSAPERPIGPGEAVRIMTGAPMPPGADAVVMVEQTERQGGIAGQPPVAGERVRIDAPVEPGFGIRHAGDDVNPGEVVFRAGTVITPPVLGVLASINHIEVDVYPRATVGVFSTGDELVDDGGPLAPGQIRESNRRILAGLLRENGCTVVDYGIIADDTAALDAALRRGATECDALVTSGGVSMGDYDVVKAVLAKIADMDWFQIAIKPAKPFAFGTLADTPVFGLPGNPVSSLVSFEMMARPALRRMMGHTRLARPTLVGVLDDDIMRRPDGKLHLMRVSTEFADDGRCHVRPAHAQGSHQLAATALADAIAFVPDGTGLPAGAEVAVMSLR